MQVHELIKKLKKFQADLDVVFETHEPVYTVDIEKTEYGFIVVIGRG